MNDPALARHGGLIARLARHDEEVRAAQELRYEVFCRELGAQLGATANAALRDIDPYDPVCDHLLIVDRNVKGKAGISLKDGQLIGTTRLMPQHRAQAHGGFYSATEFNLDDMLNAHRGLNFAEVGRTCVDAQHRSKSVVALMWKGIGAFVRRDGIDVLIGCASFPGSQLENHALALSYLYHFHAAPRQWPVSARAALGWNMNILGREEVDPKAALKQIPTLLKGYLRLGAYVCNEAVVDKDFGTVDVLTIVPIAKVGKRYKARFGKHESDAAKTVDLDNLSN